MGLGKRTNAIEGIVTGWGKSEDSAKLHETEPKLLKVTIQTNYFDGLKSLHEISLSRNNIDTIEPGAFKDLKNLQYLYLYTNQIETLDENLFVRSAWNGLVLAATKSSR